MSGSKEASLLQHVDQYVADPKLKLKLDILYKILDVVDSKASTLLRFNGIVLAVLAIFVRFNPGDWQRYVYLILIIVLIVSCAFCFIVVQISWGFLERSNDPKIEFDDLARVACVRTRNYRIAWLISAGCGLALGVLVFVEIFRR